MVRMLVSISGTRDGQDWPQRGAVVELGVAEEAHLVSAGLAVTVTPVEAATAPEPETAMTSAPMRRAKR